MHTDEQKKQKTTSELKSIVDLFANIFSDLSNDAEFSSGLLELDIKSSFAQKIDEAVKNPLQTSFKSLELLENAIVEMLVSIVKSFFIENKDIINSVYFAKEKNNLLHYSIILNNYNLENKNIFNKFISAYEQTDYASRFPIVFQIIPDSLIDAFEKEISTNKFEIINL